MEEAYHTLLHRLLDPVDFLVGEALDLEQDAGRGAVNRLPWSHQPPYPLFRSCRTLTATVWKLLFFSLLISAALIPELECQRSLHPPSSFPSGKGRRLTVRLQLIDVDNVIPVLRTR